MGSPGTPQYFSYEDSQEGPGGTDQSGEKFLSSKGWKKKLFFFYFCTLNYIHYFKSI